MDLGKFFGTIGADATNIWNGIFGGSQQKKKQQNQPVVQSNPLTFNSQQQNNPQGSVQQPQPFTPQNNQPQTPQIGGVTHMQSTQPKPSDPLGDFIHGAEGWAGDAARNIGDLAGSANNAAARTLVGGAANAVNLFKDGFDTNKTNQDTNDFLNSVGLGEKSHSGLNKNVNYDSTAGKIGGVYGNVEGGLNPVTPILGGTEGLGTVAGATLAQNDLLNKGYDPNQVLAASDAYTAPHGVSSTQSDAQNALGVGSNALNLALGLAGADSLVPKPGTPKVAFTPHPAEIPSVAPSQLDHIVQTLRGNATGESEALPISSSLNEADNLVKPPVEPPSLPPIEEGPITTPKTPTVQEPAITTPNTRPTPIESPALGGTKPLEVPTVTKPVEAPAQTAPVVEQEIKAVQQALDKDSTKAPEAPAPVENAPIESPSTKAAKEAQPASFNPEALAQAAKDDAEKDAPTTATPKEVPSYTPPIKNGKASVPGTNRVKYTTGDANLDGIVHDSIISHKGTAETAGKRADALDEAGVTQSQRAKIRNLAVKNVDKNTGKISSDAVQKIKDILTKEESPAGITDKQLTDAGIPDFGDAPKETPPPASEPAPTGKLGTITRRAVLDGSINTPEGVSKAVADTTEAAKAEAEAAGDSIENIIKKGQSVWEKNPKATTKEASEIVDGFTPEQQKVYKDYSQELNTLRDRSGHSVDGGNQGAWYAPRQFLDEEGNSREYDPSLVNENKRTGNAKTDTQGNNLDYSTTPFEHYIQRYANATDAGVQRLVGTVEEHGIKIPDEAKANLEDALKTITDKRDEADRQLVETGDDKAYKKSQADIQSNIRQTFNKFIDDIPGSGSARRAAINDVKALRGTYEQSLTQTIGLSNVINRLADQGTKGIEALKRPIVQGLKKGINPIAKNFAMDGAEVNKLKVTNEARQAAKEFSRGTMLHEIGDNAKAVVANAGAGRNPLMKGIAKLDAGVRAGGGAGVQLGDLSTSNVRDALEIGASRPEAAGLKTVADYKKYFADYTKTQKFKDDLASVEKIQNPKIGLAGGEVAENGGKISNFLSKNVDNVIKNQVAPKLGINPENRIVREINDYWKTKLTGYAGVGSRVLGSVADAAVPVRPLRSAIKAAGSGDPAAVARATTMASHAVADTMALYGGAGVAGTLIATGLVGYTGAQPQQGSSESAFNKKYNIPPNQFFINLPGGKRVYFDPARPFAGPGVAADVVGAAATGSNPVDTATNIGGQINNQAGGSSIPDNLDNLKTGYFDTSATDSDKKYAQGQVQSAVSPATGVLNNVANWMDGTKRAPTNFNEDTASHLPILRPGVPAAKDSMGNDIPNSKQISGGSSIFSLADNPYATDQNGSAKDPIATEIARLQGAGQKNVMPTNANKNATADGNTELAKMLLDDPTYKSADPKTQADLFHKTLIGKFDTINTKLGNNDKQALLDYALAGKDSKVWLQNNDNALNYLTAKYNNADANGSLTSKDKDMSRKGSLAQQVTVAKVNKEFNVDQDTINGYADTSKTEFNKLEDDSDEKNTLLAYDQALEKAGLPSKYKNSKGGYGSAGRGGGSGNNFAFASLPSSLFGVNSSGNNKLPGYDNSSAPLFKPVADLVAPPTVASIPKGRAVSASPGVKL